MAEPLLKLEGVHTHIGHYHILHGVDLEVPAGGVTMLLGRNGAGKTTTLRTIMGLWSASQGKISFAGDDITAASTPEIARKSIAYVPEDMGIFRLMSVEENMQVAATDGPIDPERLEWIFGMFPALKKFWKSQAGILSGGQKQMLSIARGMIEPRKLLIVDEPSKGLAPAIINQLVTAFTKLKGTDTTVLLVEQNFNFARNVGDTVAVMDDGKVVHSGTMKDLAENTELQTSLLGLSMDSHQ